MLPIPSSATFMAGKFTAHSCPNCLTVAVRKSGIFISWNNVNYWHYDVEKILPFGLWILSLSKISFYQRSKRPTVNLDYITRHPTFLVKVDNAAVSLAPGTQVHSSPLSDVGLAGVGFRRANQNTDTRQQKGKDILHCGTTKIQHSSRKHFLIQNHMCVTCFTNISTWADDLRRNTDKG